MTDFINRALFSVASAPGAGNISVGAAVSGPYRTLGAAHDGQTFDVAITDGDAWEVRAGCTYTHGTTTLTRGTLEDSSTGSAISLSASAQVMVTAVSSRENFVERLMRGTQPGGRLTLTSGTPVTTSDVTGATTVYYTPYVHNTIVLWDGARWRPVTFSEVSHALGTMTADTNYDVFGYLSSGALALEKLAWTNNTTRATAVTIQDGRYCKSGDKTRLYIGTIRSTSTTATEDADRRRFVWNMYNAVKRRLIVKDATTSWTYGSTTYRQARALATNQVEIVNGIPGRIAELGVGAVCSGGAVAGQLGIGVNGITNSPDAIGSQSAVYTGGAQPTFAQANTRLDHVPAAGYTYYAWLELASTAATVTWYGSGSGLGYTAAMTGGWTA